jgi:hypothetical protein
MNSDYTQLVRRKGIIGADRFGRLEVLLGEVDIHEPEVLHANEEEGEVRALRVTERGRVGRYGLVMFAFQRVRVGERQPGGTEARVD